MDKGWALVVWIFEILFMFAPIIIGVLLSWHYLHIDISRVVIGIAFIQFGVKMFFFRRKFKKVLPEMGRHVINCAIVMMPLFGMWAIISNIASLIKGS